MDLQTNSGMPSPILTRQLSNCNILVFGQKGYGKTSFARGLVAKSQRLIILDTLGYEYEETDGVIFTEYSEMVKHLSQNPGTFRVVARMPKEPRFWGLLAGLTNVTFLIEEMDTYSDLYTIGPEISDHYKYGRHKENNVIAVSRHAQEIHPEIRKNSDVVISFRQEEPNVLKYLAAINAEGTKALPRLRKGQWKILKGKMYLEEFLSRESGEEVHINDGTADTEELEFLRKEE